MLSWASVCLSFPHRPHSTDSFTHRKMTLSLADKTSKSQKVWVIIWLQWYALCLGLSTGLYSLVVALKLLLTLWLCLCLHLQVKILPVAGADPESNRSLAVRKEEERLRVALRRESQQRRMQERQLAAASAHRQRRSVPGPSGYESFGDSDGDTNGNSVSLSAIKRNAKAGLLSSSQKNRGGCNSPSFTLLSQNWFWQV